MAEEVLYIGIDLGTFRSVMVSSDSHEEEELTVIGTPKDPIARNFLKRDVLFGNEALKNRLALNLFRPLELGVIKDTPEDREFIAHFITHLIGLSDPEGLDFDTIGAASGGYDGNLIELTYYNVAISVGDRDTLETYLADKWGIVLP